MLNFVFAKEGLSEKTGNKLSKVLVKNAQSPTLLLLSGGSCFDILKFIEIPEDLKNLTIGMIDERFSGKIDENNFAQLMRLSFYNTAKEKGARFIDSVPKRGETLKEFCERLNEEITSWIKATPDGKIIATLGIGEDGHVAGIMPYPENPEKFKSLFERYVGWVIAYDALEKNKYPLRATINNWFLRQKVDFAIVYAVGKNKKNALARTFSKAGILPETPARIINEMKEVLVFTDQKVL